MYVCVCVCEREREREREERQTDRARRTDGRTKELSDRPGNGSSAYL